jgi:hypothetical protein
MIRLLPLATEPVRRELTAARHSENTDDFSGAPNRSHQRDEFPALPAAGPQYGGLIGVLRNL